MSVSPVRGRILVALMRGPASVRELREERGVGTTTNATWTRLRAMEDAGLVRRSDERADGSHVWQLTREGRLAAREVPMEPHDTSGPPEAESHPLEDETV